MSQTEPQATVEVTETQTGEDTNVTDVPNIETAAPKKRRRRKQGPGKFEDLAKDSKDVLDIDIFTGAKFIVNNLPFAPNTTVSMNTAYDQTSKEKKTLDFSTNIQTPYGKFFGKLDDKFNYTGKHNYSINKKLHVQTTVQSKPVLNGTLEVEKKGRDYNAVFKIAQPKNDSAFLDLTYLQNINRRIAVGARLATQYDKEAHLAFGARYKQVTRGLNCVATVQATDSGLFKATYTQKFVPGVSLATQLLAGPSALTKQLTANTSIGALYDWQSFKFQGAIKSTGEVCAQFQNVLPNNMAVIVSGSMNHLTKQNQFGFGFRMN